ncbi:MAG: pilus assembly protein [Pseudomonas sp. CO183]|jgi:pilus assembly protein Flp/PilA|nr:MAG: pilus assembly protein [Pseudomonas sp. CO183]
MKLQSIKSAVVRFAKDEEGLTTVEYAIAGGLVAATLITAFTNLGTIVLQKINAIITGLGGTAG